MVLPSGRVGEAEDAVAAAEAHAAEAVQRILGQLVVIVGGARQQRRCGGRRPSQARPRRQPSRRVLRANMRVVSWGIGAAGGLGLEEGSRTILLKGALGRASSMPPN